MRGKYASSALFCALVTNAGTIPPRAIWTTGKPTLVGSPSPDGRWLSCVHPTTGDLAVRDTRTGAMRQVTRKEPGSREFAHFSVFSRDGARIAYAWFNKQGFYELRVVDPNGSTAPKTIFSNEEAGFVQPTSWSPDGARILTLLFRKDNISQIAMVSLDGTVQVLKSLPWVYPKRMELSPDGEWIVYDSFAGNRPGQRDIWLLAADGSGERKVVEDPVDDVFPMWSQTGSHILFVSDRSGARSLWLRSVNGSDPPRRISADLGPILPMGLTNDGALFYGIKAGSTFAVVKTVDRPLLRIEGKSPAIAHSGTSIAYLLRAASDNYGEDAFVIHVRSLADGTDRELRTTLAHVERMRWSPDDSTLLVSGSDGKGRKGLFTTSIVDGRTQPIVIDENASFRGLPGAWIDDGNILFLRGGRTFALDLRTGTESEAADISMNDLEKAPARALTATTEGEVHNEIWSLRLQLPHP
jgi:Tol biopolymer transport system component